MKSHVLIPLILLGLFAESRAQETGPESFSLQESIDYAMEHSYSVINASREVIDAEKQKWEVIATGLPQISGSVSYQNQIKQQISVLPTEFFGGEPGQTIAIPFGLPQSMVAVGELRQKIFDGIYIVGVQATKAFLSYSQNNYDKTLLEVRSEVIQAYGNVLLARETVDILEKNRASIEKTLYETKRLYENGLTDEESVDQLQITLTNLENQLSFARRNVRITEQFLNLVMGREVGLPIAVTINLEGVAMQKMGLGIMDQQMTLEDNVDYRLARNLNEQRFYELKQAKSRALPTLTTFINLGVNSFAFEGFPFLNENQPWYGFSTWGVDLRIPIFSSMGRSASTQRAKIALEQAKTQLKEAEERIYLEYETSKSNFILSVEQYNTLRSNLELAERIENKNQIKYSEGIASSFDLLQAQNQLYAAQQDYLQSMVEVINAKTRLENVLSSFN